MGVHVPWRCGEGLFCLAAVWRCRLIDDKRSMAVFVGRPVVQMVHLRRFFCVSGAFASSPRFIRRYSCLSAWPFICSVISQSHMDSEEMPGFRFKSSDCIRSVLLSN